MTTQTTSAAFGAAHQVSSNNIDASQCQRQFDLACDALRSLRRDDATADAVRKLNFKLIDECIDNAVKGGFALEIGLSLYGDVLSDIEKIFFDRGAYAAMTYRSASKPAQTQQPRRLVA